MAEILTAPDQFSNALDRAAAEGVARVEAAIGPENAEPIQEALTNSEIIWNLVHEEHDAKDGAKVIERFYLPENLTDEAEDLLSELASGMGELVRNQARNYPILDDWQPTEINVQRYDETCFVSSHQDFTENRGIILVLSISDMAMFNAGSTREAQDFTWLVNPGDLVLLRSTGLGEPGVGGLYHSIDQPWDGDRISIGFRDNRG